MADSIEVLQAEATEIRERIQPARDAIRDDEQRLERLEVAIQVLTSDVPWSAPNASPTRRRTRSGSREPSGIDEDAIVTFVGANQPVDHAAIRAHLRLDDSKSGNLSTKLSRMVKDGVLTREGPKRASKYTLAVKGE